MAIQNLSHIFIFLFFVLTSLIQLLQKNLAHIRRLRHGRFWSYLLSCDTLTEYAEFVKYSDSKAFYLQILKSFIKLFFAVCTETHVSNNNRVNT